VVDVAWSLVRVVEYMCVKEKDFNIQKACNQGNILT
jgi:hypothetical protein